GGSRSLSVARGGVDAEGALAVRPASENASATTHHPAPANRMTGRKACVWRAPCQYCARRRQFFAREAFDARSADFHVGARNWDGTVDGVREGTGQGAAAPGGSAGATPRSAGGRG